MATATIDMIEKPNETVMILSESSYDIMSQNCSTLIEGMISIAARRPWMAVVLSFYFVVGFFGNGILVVLFLKEKSLRDISNALITNLAASDCLYVGLFVPILIFAEFHLFRPFGHAFCVISIMANYTSQDVSTLSLTALSYFRYCAVVRPFQSRMKRRSKLIAIFCLLSWLIGAAFSIYPARHCEEHPRRDCLVWGLHRVDSYTFNEKFLKYFWIRFGFLYLLPLFIITYFYGAVAYTLFIASAPLENNESVQSNSKAMSRSRKKLSVVVLIIVVTFFVSWMPTYAYWLTLLDDNMVDGFLAPLRLTTMFIPATMNPIIMFVTSTSHRKGLLSILLCRYLKPTVRTSTSSSHMRTRLSDVTGRSGNQAQSSSLESKTDIDTTKEGAHQV